MHAFLGSVYPLDFVALGARVNVGDDGGKVLLLVKLTDHAIIDVRHSNFIKILFEVIIFQCNFLCSSQFDNLVKEVNKHL